ncbi:MAG: hypothetical protein GX493_13485, partial [Firmicutes bacterium]|nr:hypothetical protein [Bacillota bacterium]
MRRTLFNPLLNERAEVEGVFLVGLNGLALSAGTRTTRYGLFDGLALLANVAWWNNLPPYGTMLISGVHRQTYAGNLPVITLARRIVQPENPSRTLGVFWVDIRLERLAEIARRVRLGRTGYLCILNSQGQVIYHPETDLIGKPLKLPFFHKLQNGNGYRFLVKVN